MTIDLSTLIAILAMAFATYLTRVSGFVIGPYLPKSGRIRNALDAVPAAVLTAVVAPSLMNGPAEMIAALATIVAARRLPTLAAIAVGVGVVYTGRQILKLM